LTGLQGLGLGEGSVVFMLQRVGWRWTACGTKMSQNGEGLVATVVEYAGFRVQAGDRRRACHCH
jgi:hypothetical protein